MHNIYGCIINVEGKGNYKILIEKNYPEIKLEKFDICIANANILKKIDWSLV